MIKGVGAKAWAFLFILTGLNLFNYVDRFLLNGVLVPIQQEFQLNDSQLGRLNTIFLFSYFLAAPLFGFFGDHVSRKRLIAVGVGVGGLATMATSWSRSYDDLLGARALVGLAEASFGALAPTLICDCFKGPQRNSAISIFYLALPVGGALGYILGGQLHEVWGWRVAFFWVGLISMLLMFSLQLLREPARGAMEEPQVVDTLQLPKVTDAIRLLGNQRYMFVILGYVGYTFAMGALAVWAPIFLVRQHGLSNATATLFFGSVAVVTGILGTMIGGTWSSRRVEQDPKAYDKVLFASVFFAIPILLIALWSDRLWISQFGFVGAMLVLFLSTGPINTLILEIVPVALRGTAMALAIFFIRLGGDLWSPELVGHWSDHRGDLREALMLVVGAFLVASVFWSLGLLQLRSQGYASPTSPNTDKSNDLQKPT